jgi:protein-S-isoprenylcysteine O-methyltransferase Ste14
MLPIYAFAHYWFFLRTRIGFLFFVLVTVCIVERAWETFKTSKERRREDLHGDWTLAAVTGTYLALFFFFVTEFYLRVQSFQWTKAIFGAILLGISFRLRFWGMAALGKQWAVHAVGARKIKKVRLIRLGPYRYIRHPIYLGIMFEEIAYPVLANTTFALLFALFCCVPLVVVRAIWEEKNAKRRLGEKYELYKREVGMFFPTQLLKI